MYVEDELARVDGLDESLQLSIIRVRGVRHFEVEWQVLIILIVPAGQNDKYRRLFSIAFVYAENRNKDRELRKIK